MMLSAADLKIDHATVAGHDLRAMQAALRDAGIETVYGGAHANHITEMALASFPDGSYLELIAVQAHADPAAIEHHEWGRFLHEAGIPCAWAVQAGDLAAEATRLRAAGVAVSDPVRAGRRRPDGTNLEWETVDVGSGVRGAFFPFLIHDLTARDLRAFPGGKPVTRDYRGIARVVIAVRSLDAAVARYRAAFGLPEATRQADRDFGAELAAMPGSPVVFAQPLGGDSWIEARIAKFGEGPCAFVLAGVRRPAAGGAKSRWFGREITWADPARLGWRLGVE
jgi:catechol 2,3-dioxygenase-like lactoylglutathione lyase family enzyme